MTAKPILKQNIIDVELWYFDITKKNIITEV